MKLLRTLRRDTSGATLVEFALVSPVLLLMLLGMFDMSYNYYVQAQLQGAVQAAARHSSIEGAEFRAAAIDANVTKAVRHLVPSASVDFSRKSYTTFSDVARPEDFSDVDGDGICGGGEPFEDGNGNGTWDEDRGLSGTGGARDAVLYVVDIRYPRPFNVGGFINLPDHVTMQAATVLRNQPYQDQVVASRVGNCP